MSPIYMNMPRACISCTHYEPIGFAHDEHCPFTEWGHIRKTRTQYGHCDLHDVDTFATEICNSHQVEPFVETTEVTNRPVPMTPKQERLELIEVTTR